MSTFPVSVVSFCVSDLPQNYLVAHRPSVPSGSATMPTGLAPSRSIAPGCSPAARWRIGTSSQCDSFVFVGIRVDSAEHTTNFFERGANLLHWICTLTPFGKRRSRSGMELQNCHAPSFVLQTAPCQLPPICELTLPLPTYHRIVHMHFGGK